MARQLVLSKNNLFFYFIIFGYLFGVILYDYLKFDYTDELMALFLVLFTLVVAFERRNPKELIPLAVLALVFLFYLTYSFYIHSNVPQAILMDFAVQIKPYLGFYCTLFIAPRFTVSQRRIIVILCLCVAVFILMVGITGNIYTVFGHPSRYATATVATAFLFLYCTSYLWSDVVVFIIILSIGFFSTRSKFYGLWVISSFFAIYSKVTNGTIKLNLKGLVWVLVGCSAALLLAWDKIVVYYINGAMNDGEMWSRPAMMLASTWLFADYFPFGTGFASFGTFFSGEYYSHIYGLYGLDHLFGISPETRFFISDAFYPALAQFGIVGVLLYLMFWYSVVRMAAKGSIQDLKLYLIPVLATVFFLIEGVADSTFTHNRGLFILILTGMALAEKKAISNEDIPANK